MLMALHLAAECGLACVGCREPGAETLAKNRRLLLAGWAFSWSVLFMLFFVLLIIAGMSSTSGKPVGDWIEAALRVSDG